MFELAKMTPVAAGGVRSVYQHPERADLLIKVIKESVVHKYEGQWHKGLKFRRRIGRYASFSREITEFMSTRAQNGRHPDVLERIEGFAETDLGLGMVVERYAGADGGLAPLFSEVVRRVPFDQDNWRLVDELQKGVDDFNVVLGDLSAGNMVCTENDPQRRRLVIIDTYGDKHVIPIHSMSRRLNSHRNARKFRKLRAKIAAIAGIAPGEGSLRAPLTA